MPQKKKPLSDGTRTVDELIVKAKKTRRETAKTIEALQVLRKELQERNRTRS
jgi:hypothetical protein